MKVPKTIQSRSIYSNSYINIRVDTLKYNGKQWEQAYFTKPNKDSVGILPVTSEGIYLVSQYRHASKDYFWQIPMGMVDQNSSEREAAVHELAEETGLIANDLVKIGSFNAEPGMSPANTHIYVATGLKDGKARPEASEVALQSKLFTFKEIKEAVSSGVIHCGFTLSALYLYNEYKEKI